MDMEHKDPKPLDAHLEHARPSARFATDDSHSLAPATTVDTEKGSTSAYANSETGLQLRQDRIKDEKKLLWKLG